MQYLIVKSFINNVLAALQAIKYTKRKFIFQLALDIMWSIYATLMNDLTESIVQLVPCCLYRVISCRAASLCATPSYFSRVISRSIINAKPS